MNDRRKLWIGVLGACAVATLLFAHRQRAGVRRARVRLERVATEVEDLGRIVAARTAEIHSADPAGAAAAEEEVDPAQTPLGVLARVEEYARTAGVRCERVDFEDDPGGVMGLCRVTGAGDPESIVAFLAALEADRAPLAIRRLDVQTGESGPLAFQVGVGAFFDSSLDAHGEVPR